MQGLNDFLDENLSMGPSDDQEGAAHGLDPSLHPMEGVEGEDWCDNEVLSKSAMDGERPSRPRTAA